MVASALCFLALGLSLLFYGVKLHIIAAREATARIRARQDGRNLAPQVSWGPNESRFRTEAICFLLLTIFISRAIFDLVQLDIFVLPVTLVKYGKDITNPVVFWLFFGWEICPTALMLFFFGTAVTQAQQTATQARLMSERLTIVDSVDNDGGGYDEDDEDGLIETGASNALWPIPKDLADIVVSKNLAQGSLDTSMQGTSGHGHKVGLLEDDGRYDSPSDNLYGFSSPLPAHQAVSRGWAAAMGQPLYLGQPHQPPAGGMPGSGFHPYQPPVVPPEALAAQQGAQPTGNWPQSTPTPPLGSLAGSAGEGVRPGGGGGGGGPNR